MDRGLLFRQESGWQGYPNLKQDRKPIAWSPEADRYDALRSRRPYKEAYSHEKTLAVMTNDDRSGISGRDWYGYEIWGVFEKHHLRFKDVFERMQE